MPDLSFQSGDHVRFWDYYVGEPTQIGSGTVIAVSDGSATIRVTYSDLDDEPCDDEYPDPIPFAQIERTNRPPPNDDDDPTR